MPGPASGRDADQMHAHIRAYSVGGDSQPLASSAAETGFWPPTAQRTQQFYDQPDPSREAKAFDAAEDGRSAACAKVRDGGSVDLVVFASPIKRWVVRFVFWDCV